MADRSHHPRLTGADMVQWELESDGRPMRRLNCRRASPHLGRSGDDVVDLTDHSAWRSPMRTGPIHTGKAYPVDSGSATCCGLNDRIRSVAGTTIDGQRAFAFAISGSVF